MASKELDGGGKMIRKANVDGISSFPDEVLSHILSLLPTKCAVGTSILSSRWKYLWTSINCLDFEADDSNDKDSYSVDFTKFVDHVFTNCSSQHIEKFILHLHNYLADKSHLNAWIDEAIKRNVSELDIYTSHLPWSVLSCTTLTVLTLGGSFYCGKKIPLFNLPCLKVLHIELFCSYKGFVEKLIESCPVIKDFTLEGFLQDLGYGEGDIFMISSPTLRTLRIQLCPSGRGTNKISIMCPNLEYLHLRESFVYYNIEGDFSSLVKANMDIADTFSCRRHRHFSFHYRKETYSYTLPKFHNLTSLKVIIRGNLFLKMLPKLLESSPCLEDLSLQPNEHEQGLDKPDLQGEYTWSEPESVSKCLRSHLAVIKIEGFRGRKREMQLLKYFLGNAEALRRLNISCQRLTQVEEIQFCAQLLKFSRASSSCEIQFNGDFVTNL